MNQSEKQLQEKMMSQLEWLRKELENQPAYLRRNVKLSDTPLSSESEVSRYTLSEENDNVEIKANNSFLHDNVD